MKVKLLVLFVLGTSGLCRGQDVPITYAEETDSLPKQYFIDRYENVFMTKVPTRQMLKLDYTSSDYRGAGFQLGYEYKFLPTLSLEAALYAQRSFGNGLSLSVPVAFNYWGHAKARWYPNMHKRMSNGLSANNFSGQYLGFSYDHSFSFSKRMTSYHEPINRVGLIWGFQSRFFSTGHVDFSIGLFNRPIWGVFPENYSKNFISVKDFVLATQPVMGIAIGDWKKTGAAAKCEALFCEEDIQHQWKVSLPDVTIGQKHQNIGVDVALENRLGRSPFSIQPKLAVNYYRRHVLDEFNYVNRTLGLSFQFRYYAFQKLRARKGKSGYNFSGPYASFLTGYYLIRNRYRLNSEREVQTVGNIGIEPAIGFQQRLFKKLFIDGSVYHFKNVISKYPADRKGYFGARLGLGFTF